MLSSLGQRAQLPQAKDKAPRESSLIITGDIGCYTLGAYPPLSALDSSACMGASIGEAIGMQKAGVKKKVVAVIGDSTFLHSGITGLVDAVYGKARITIVILDNSTTAMTGHQEHSGTGVTAQSKAAGRVVLEELVRGVGVKNVKVVNAFDLKEVRPAVKSALESEELSVIIVRGACAVKTPRRAEPRAIDIDECNMCGACFLIGCPSIQMEGDKVIIDSSLCVGDSCTLCQQICPRQAIKPKSQVKVAK